MNKTRLALGPLLVLLLAAGCIDALSQNGRTCPCDTGWACCNGQCILETQECQFQLQATVGYGGGELLADDGSGIVFPPGALLQDTVITMTSIPALELTPDLTRIGTAVMFEPEYLAFSIEEQYRPTLRLTYQVDAIPAGTDPHRIAIYGASNGTTAFQGALAQMVDTNHLEMTISRLLTYVPAIAPEVCTCGGGMTAEECHAFQSVDGHTYGVICPQDDTPPVTCTCIEDGVEVGTVETPECGWTSGAYRGCGFPCATTCP